MQSGGQLRAGLLGPPHSWKSLPLLRPPGSWRQKAGSQEGAGCGGTQPFPESRVEHGGWGRLCWLTSRSSSFHFPSSAPISQTQLGPRGVAQAAASLGPRGPRTAGWGWGCQVVSVPLVLQVEGKSDAAHSREPAM